ncbi:MAG: hypothetical protein JWP97_1347 [Labilithrix sp.]|nr:hypothetical protein [Labilithrix sp.]
MNRRELLRAAVIGLAFGTAALASGCRKDAARCKNCGMKIDASSAWRAELVAPSGELVPFDSPRCALQSWRTGKTSAKAIRVLDYYDRASKDGAEVRFVLGGDVVGPMGPDLVPVDPARVSKFMQDHAADRALRLDEITPEILGSVGAK